MTNTVTLTNCRMYKKLPTNVPENYKAFNLL